MTSTEKPSPATSAQVATTGGDKDSILVSSQGRTTIADTVVSKIAGIATKEVTGVYALGGGGARAVGALRDRIPGARTNHSQGVSVEVGERQAAIDVDIVAEYGVSMNDLATGIRRNVISAVERMTGLEVTEVNITVHDVHLDDGTDAEEETVAEPTPEPGAVTDGPVGTDVPGTAPVELEDRIAAAVLRVPGVDSLHGGAFGEVATYLPGRKVHGIRTGPDGTDVHVTVVYGRPVREVAEQVRRAVTGVVPGAVQVTIEDLVPETAPGALPDGAR